LVPFAGITFLWFIGVVRDRIGRREDRFFATIFLGSGLLFIGTLFIAAALAGGLIADATLPSGLGLHPTTVAPGRQVALLLVRVYAMRMAGVFTLSSATILLRTEAAPKWISVLGIAIALSLLITLGLSPWLYLLFPAWIGLVSGHLLLRSFVQVPPEA
jgi:Na+/phosphate symporter